MTVDVIQSDLKAINSGKISIPFRGEEEMEQCDWELVTGDMKNETRFDKFLNVLNTMTGIDSRLHQVRFNMCMSTFHALVVGMSLGKSSFSVSPLDYCAETATMSAESSVVCCYSISGVVSDHVFLLNGDTSISST